ncbi:wax ester/triacylglycerol synthase family O-acyltransferase [Desulfobacterales bacterium HSG16]|nr:wax ester/triacylglycerol synthase family O-acyltransferase [Desulfobacterales bacterium HSG16]
MTEQMTNVDNFWLCMDDPTNLMMISAFMEFDKVLDYERLVTTIEARLLARYSRFRKKVVRPISGVGVPDWEIDEHFDIRSHLHRIALPGTGEKKDLQHMVADLMAMPLDESKPLWHFHLIENYKGGCVFFGRLHHCIADGIALIQVLLSLTDKDKNAPIPTVEKRVASNRPFSLRSVLPFTKVAKNVKGVLETAKTIRKRVGQEVTDSISNPVHLLEMARTATGVAADVANVITRISLLPSHPKNSFKGTLGIRKSVAWTDPIELGSVKTVGRVVEATLNDVLIATVTGALRRYLKTRNDKINELDLQVTVPVNIRKPGTELELGNKFSLVWLALPVHIEDPIVRLREVKRRMDKLKNSPDAFVAFSILNALGMSPSKLAKRAAHIFANKSTAVLTNVPGPKQPLYFCGEEVKNMMFWVPRSGRVGLGISILSYNDTVTVGLATDDGLVPDPEKILEGFEDDFNNLLDLVKSGKVFEGPLVINDRYEEGNQQREQDACECYGEDIIQEPENSAPCLALTKSGRPCKKVSVAGSDYCSVHQKYDPEQSNDELADDNEEEASTEIYASDEYEDDKSLQDTADTIGDEPEIRQMAASDAE